MPIAVPDLGIVHDDDDIVVVGATSHPGRLTDLLGSVATVVVHRAKGPVVPAGWVPGTSQSKATDASSTNLMPAPHPSGP